MALYGFQDKRVAETLLRIGKQGVHTGTSATVGGTVDNGSRIFIIGRHDGIPAAKKVPLTGDQAGFYKWQPGTATCTVMIIQNDGDAENPDYVLRERVAVKGSRASLDISLTRTVYNFSPYPIHAVYAEPEETGADFTVAVEDSFGRLVAIPPTPRNVILYGLRDDKDRVLSSFDEAIVWSADDAEFQSAIPRTMLPDIYAYDSQTPIRNPLGLPSGTPALIMEQPDMRYAVACSPWLYIKPPDFELYPFLKGEVIQAKGHPATHLFVVQADTDMLPSQSGWSPKRRPVPVMPLTVYGYAAPKITGPVRDRRFYAYTAATRSLSLGSGPYRYECGVWSILATYVDVGEYDKSAGTFTVPSFSTDGNTSFDVGVVGSPASGFFQYVSGTCSGILRFSGHSYHSPISGNSFDIAGLWGATITPQLDIRSGVTLLCCSSPADSGWSVYNPAPLSQTPETLCIHQVGIFYKKD